jgi:hypothetical protein
MSWRIERTAECKGIERILNAMPWASLLVAGSASVGKERAAEWLATPAPFGTRLFYCVKRSILYPEPASGLYAHIDVTEISLHFDVSAAELPRRPWRSTPFIEAREGSTGRIGEFNGQIVRALKEAVVEFVEPVLGEPWDFGESLTHWDDGKGSFSVELYYEPEEHGLVERPGLRPRG